jgi:hypothetical protein
LRGWTTIITSMSSGMLATSVAIVCTVNSSRSCAMLVQPSRSWPDIGSKPASTDRLDIKPIVGRFGWPSR